MTTARLILLSLRNRLGNVRIASYARERYLLYSILDAFTGSWMETGRYNPHFDLS